MTRDLAPQQPGETLPQSSRGDEARSSESRALPAATALACGASVLLFLSHQDGGGRAEPRPPHLTPDDFRHWLALGAQLADWVIPKALLLRCQHSLRQLPGGAGRGGAQGGALSTFPGRMAKEVSAGRVVAGRTDGLWADGCHAGYLGDGWINRLYHFPRV